MATNMRSFAHVLVSPFSGRSGRGGRLASLLVALSWLIPLVAGPDARAVTPQSPEVRKLIEEGLRFLELPMGPGNGEKLGGKCLVGLAFLKANRHDHPRVAEAVAACRETMAAPVDLQVFDVYSNGLAIIFLCELSSTEYAREIQWYLDQMQQRQKEHGGWGYSNLTGGDTSQTQYGALGYWEAHRRGFRLQPGSVESLADWLIRSQGPDGCWGYQGVVGPPGELVPQNGSSCSMLAAGLGSTYICADLFGFHGTVNSAAQSATDDVVKTPLPAALRPTGVEQARSTGQIIRTQRITDNDLSKTIQGAHGWMKINYRIDIPNYSYYYLYALERYKSFQEYFDGDTEEEPQWYNEGFDFLVKRKLADGWNGGCGPECDTAFAVLFLLRSTQQSIRKGLGEGALLSGRGLPSNLSKVKLVGGQLVIEQTRTRVDEMLAMIDAGDDALLDDLARDPSQLVVEKVDAQNARRLQQLARGGEPEVRLLAVRVLGRSGNFDYVPTLIYALTDPDRRIVLEARDSLRFVSRRFGGFGLPDDFTDQQRYAAVDAWKQWYRSMRPDAIVE